MARSAFVGPTCLWPVELLSQGEELHLAPHSAILLTASLYSVSVFRTYIALSRHTEVLIGSCERSAFHTKSHFGGEIFFCSLMFRSFAENSAAHGYPAVGNG